MSSSIGDKPAAASIARADFSPKFLPSRYLSDSTCDRRASSMPVSRANCAAFPPVLCWIIALRRCLRCACMSMLKFKPTFIICDTIVCLTVYLSVAKVRAMKKLLDYLNGRPVAAQEDFAKRCATTVGYLRQIAYGHRECQAALAINIERESAREITCEELCPIGVDWSYIRAERRRKGPRRSQPDRRVIPDPPADATGE